MASSRTSDDLATAASKLSLKTGAGPKATTKAEVADDWEDEAGSDDDEVTDTPTTAAPAGKAGTDPPPPTPISPTTKYVPFATDYDLGSRSLGGRAEASRPEKTDAVARRMIAAGLGMRMPKRTEEQKEYEKAMKEKERKRREDEREAQRRKESEATKAKQAIWED